jgi:FHS family L-fucose permease-like MFS transporter
VQVSKPVPAVNERKPGGASLFPSGHLLPFVLVTFLFFLWGIPNNLTDVLIRQFMKSFAISRF